MGYTEKQVGDIEEGLQTTNIASIGESDPPLIHLGVFGRIVAIVKKTVLVGAISIILYFACLYMPNMENVEERQLPDQKGITCTKNGGECTQANMKCNCPTGSACACNFWCDLDRHCNGGQNTGDFKCCYTGNEVWDCIDKDETC